ncbi:hypothetical protein BP6252_03860 [Coleophoma cylindrospora]|uniref:Peptide N-acetyl-beta-D-glucosaminyl asparaginase amidase A N-terminal domain-containing protein n=1 Tax=Coleophoma cylindrospora TaxID=1849047 RepID=A0A3D8SAC4_9HELO|nr:hypothetical protein BP6252_03860 [Coleophoma cylindrospora]
MRSFLLQGLFSAYVLAGMVVQRAPYPIQDRQAVSPSQPLVDFQVYEPVLTPSGSSNEYGCIYTKTLMEHQFASSYGIPFVGNYTPPPCSFNRVTMNFTVTSVGRQYDRLAMMYLGDVEVFRTSTAEPSTNLSIVYTYTKEMQQYNALWKTDQKIIFELDNIYDSTYTGAWNTTLTATFFTIPDSPAVADQILPISSLSSGSDSASAFSIPGVNASVSYVLPKNINRAVVSLEACGQSAEEFWYTNVPTSTVDTFAATAGSYYGGGPWREVQLLIDGQIAGVSWPFPIVFTGGIVPGFWRPMVAIDAFDLRQHEIDITPWLGQLLDGESHTFEIRVASLNDDGNGHVTVIDTTNSYWIVTGTIFLFLDAEGSVTTGTKPVITAPEPVFGFSSSVSEVSGVNDSLIYEVSASRQISVSAIIRSAKSTHNASWSQTLSYYNYDAITAEGFDQYTLQTTNGKDVSTSGYSNIYSYPMNVNSSYSQTSTALGINGSIVHGLDFEVYGPSVFPSGIQVFNNTAPSFFNLGGDQTPQSIQVSSSLPKFSGAVLSTTQSSVAQYYSSTNNSYSFGTTSQDFTFGGVEVGEPGTTYELYSRHVKAVNNTIAYDGQTLVGESFGIGTTNHGATTKMDNAHWKAYSVKAILGKGDGPPKIGS